MPIRELYFSVGVVYIDTLDDILVSIIPDRYGLGGLHCWCGFYLDFVDTSVVRRNPAISSNRRRRGVLLAIESRRLQLALKAEGPVEGLIAGDGGETWTCWWW